MQEENVLSRARLKVDSGVQAEKGQSSEQEERQTSKPHCLP